MGTKSSKKIVKQVSGFLYEENALTTSAGAADADFIPALNSQGVLDDSILNASASKSANKVVKSNGDGVIDPSIVNGTVLSAGAGDSGKFPQLDGTGRIDSSVLPVGIGADTAQITTSEALASGDLVNIWNSSGAKVRKADASSVGKEAMGFVLASAASGAMATVYFEGTNTAMTGLTPGLQFLSTTPGKTASSAPSAPAVVQRVGFAISATAMNFNAGMPVVLA